MKRIAIIAALALASCATTPCKPPEPIVQTVTVKEPVDDPACVRAAIAKLGPTPSYPDTPATIKAAPNLYARVQLVLAGRELRMAHEAAQAAALDGCSK